MIFVIVDVGIGKLSEVMVVMELGVDVVLVNMVIVIVKNLVVMVVVFVSVVEMGWKVFEVGFGVISSFV